MTDFNVGDRVRIINSGTLDGETGTIGPRTFPHDPGPDQVWVDFDDDPKYDFKDSGWFPAEALERIEGPGS